MKCAFLIALPVVLAVELGLAPGAQSGEANFQLECDMMCETVSEWHDSIDAARKACELHSECLAVVDHSATGGKQGLCLKGAAFGQGSRDSSVLRGVCVEYKGQSPPANLLQVAAGQASSDSASADVAELFARECDMMCDGTIASFDSLFAARRACAASTDCAAVVDHSGNKGKFGLCSSSMTISRGSEKHEVFTRVCVERKRDM